MSLVYRSCKDSPPRSCPGYEVNQVSSCWKVSNPGVFPHDPFVDSWRRYVHERLCLFARLLNGPRNSARALGTFGPLNQFCRKYAESSKYSRFLSPQPSITIIEMVHRANWNTSHFKPTAPNPAEQRRAAFCLKVMILNKFVIKTHFFSSGILTIDEYQFVRRFTSFYK